MWGCQDELGVAACSNLPGLWEADRRTCRWPSAELCLSTCGQCPLVHAARECKSLEHECCLMDTKNEHIDWSTFFHTITNTTTSMGEHNYRKGARFTFFHALTNTTISSTTTSMGEHDYRKGARVLNEETPWVAEFPFYLSNEEADELIRIAAQEGYRKEDDLPKHVRDVNVTNCDSIRCMREPLMGELSRRASELVGLPSNNFESMEFIHYGPGQHYVWHADEYSWRYPPKTADPVAVVSGPRLLTMFYYLSDVEEGGETAFAGPDPSGRSPRLKVKPQKGKVILWANMKDDWRSNEPAGVHSAQPVQKGEKLAATLWIHASGFRIPELYAGRDCHPRYN
jgi:prolyl 4-hydroxylase